MSWKQVPEFPTYEASDDGQVRNIRTGKLLKPSVRRDGTGIPLVSLVRDQKVTVHEVKYIIVCTFLGVDINANPKPKTEYIDGNKFNNALSNIRIKQVELIEDEEWRPIEGFETSYAVSNKGRVKRLPRIDRYIRKDTGVEVERKVSEMILKPSEKDEYWEINLREGQKSVYRTVHRMVAQAFIPNLNNLPEVNHKDGNKHNNNVDNLEWCTPKENTQHAISTGLRKSTKGVDARQKQIRCVETGQIFNSATEVCKQYGFPRDYLYDRIHKRKPCHNLNFVAIIEDRRVKCLDTNEIFDSVQAVKDKFGFDISGSIKRRTCVDGWTFCYMKDDVDEASYLKECREKYSKWPRANKRWEET